ncbi:ligand-dependent nuclear receptor corepressor-like protein [Pimephales promelas]|nr:ligand-dependent nuclear receptor corepressor-like protein [Pimephales promelas]
MASPCTKRLCTNERFVSRQDADCWRSEFIHCVGLDSISAVLWRTSVVEDLGRLTDCKPASVSNWSFDESCLYCCLRREKVKEHVVALNKQIVESGGKPLLGKDPSNINRLEWQSEEFLNAVLQRKKYTPRIPDPHIPVVACGIVQQMINELATYYTSRKKCSQDSLQNNGEKDLMKTSCVISPTAVNITSALNKFIMVDQDAPLDLSVKKVKVEDIEQDGVLDLSTRKSSNKSHTSLRNSNSLATHLVKRDSVDPSLAREGDLQSVSTLEQFMSKLCLHHQRQIVDALGFLQSEVKTVASSNPFQAPTPNLTEKKATTSCSRASFETRSERTCTVDAAKEGCESQIEPMLEEVECGTESEDKALEPSLIPASPNMAVESSDGVDVEPRNESEMTNPTEVETAADVHKQSETSEIKANTEEDKSSQEQVSHDTESNLQTTNSSKLPVKDQGDSVVSSLTEVSTGQPLLKCKEKDTEQHSPKVVNAKPTVSSDRCLRSRVSKGSVDLVKDSVKCAASERERANDTKTQSTETKARIEEECDLKALEILETAQELPATKPCSSLVVDRAVKTRPKLRNAKERDEQTSPSIKMNEELPSVLPPEVLPETVSTPSTSTQNGKHHKRNNQASESSEKMAIKTESSPIKLSDSGDWTPIKKSPPSSENMLLRSRSNTERTFGCKSGNPTEGLSEKQGQMPLRSSSSASEQATNKDSCTSSEGVTRMPLRSRTISTTKQTVTKDTPLKSSIKSCASEHPISSQSSTTCRKTEANAHMPLRSSASLIAEPPHDKSAIVDALESPGRMSLRRGNASNTEKSVGSTTPPSKSKRPLRPQRVSASSSGEAEESPLSSKPKTQTRKHMEPQIRGPLNIPGESLCITGFQRTEPVVCSASKFFEALRGEEHQQIISNLNTTFEKMHKGWVQMDKEGQPASKPKNKADRLKEIWKSKRRARKSRPLEPQKFSPVQMLFMKPFDLPSICRWFLQSTETKSLVIVKKVNTRLPSETQLCFHSSSAGAGSSQGIFPSLQAERLKKHLKKFAMASPVKSNPKNQRLISKALGQGISVMKSKEKHEPTTATRISTKAQSLNGVALAPESLGAIAGVAKNPASARILRKYSNMREKLQVQQNKKCKEKGARLKAALIPKKVDKPKLQTPKGPKSVVVQRIKSFTKKPKANSALKEQALKKNQCVKHGASPKRLQALKKMTKAIGENASGKQRILLKSGTKAQQIKTSGTKADIKKSVLQKGSNSSEPHSLDVDIKPLALEDQVLTRSQRKMEVSSAQTGSPKASTKRGLEPLVTPTKRTRTSKP